MIKPNTIFFDGRKIGTYKSMLTAGTGHIEFNGVEPYEPQLNEKQQIVLEWLKDRYLYQLRINPIGVIFALHNELFEDSEDDAVEAYEFLNIKEELQVLQTFTEWALEQEVAE